MFTELLFSLEIHLFGCKYIKAYAKVKKAKFYTFHSDQATNILKTDKEHLTSINSFVGLTFF